MSQKLPSISNLLIHTPPSTHVDAQPPPPILNLSPPSPPLSMHSQPYSPNRSPFLHPATSLNGSISAKLSPLLSPISYNSRADDTLTDLPPIHGDDPPQRLRLPSPSYLACNSLSTPSSPSHTAAGSSFSPLSPKKELFTRHYNSAIGTEGRHRWPSLSPPILHTYPTISSVDSTTRTTITTAAENRNLSSTLSQHSHRTRSKSFDESSMIMKKRKRGRPSLSSDSSSNTSTQPDLQYTFLTPTIFNHSTSSNHQTQPPLETTQSRYHSATSHAVPNDTKTNNTSTKATTTVHTTAMTTQQVPDSTTMMTAFTNSNMDTVLNMPSKKRGRKPKTFLEGNSCFLWRDNTAKCNKKMK